MNYNKGEIVEVDLGLPPKAIKGHEQANIRPCLIVTSFRHMELAIILPLTGTKPPKHLYTFVHFAKGKSGLTKDSYALCHQIRTISFDRIRSRRGRVSTHEFFKVLAVLTDTLGL